MFTYLCREGYIYTYTPIYIEGRGLYLRIYEST